MCTYCPIFISWLKQIDKKVQDPVHITLNWINVLFNTPANPLVPGRWVSWESVFSSWWDNKVWSPFWFSFPCWMLPETTHTAKCIVWFWIRGSCWFWGPLSKSSFNDKIIGFLTERRMSSGYQLWVCQAGVTIIREVTFFSSTFFSTFWIKANEGNAYRLLWQHFCWRASVPRPLGPGFQG